MRVADFPGLLAGFCVALLGFFLLNVSMVTSALELAERTSFVGGISVPVTPRRDVKSGQEVVENPYNLNVVDSWQSPAEKWLGIAGWIVVALIAGATGARVGSPAKAWRGAISV